MTTDLCIHRDRAIVLAMLLGGLRVGEVRGLRLADIDFGRRLLTVVARATVSGSSRSMPGDLD